VSLAVVTAIVNARFILMGATLRPWFGALPHGRPMRRSTDRRCDLAGRAALSRGRRIGLLGLRRRRADALGRLGGLADPGYLLGASSPIRSASASI
jgi:hypothetical protein